MNTLAIQPRNATLLHRGQELAYDAFELMVMLIFVGMNLFPARALTFVNDIELARLMLIFENDPNIEGVAIVGIEAFPSENTFGHAIKSDSLNVRSTLTKGSVVRVLSMAYSSSSDQTDASPNITASGKKVGPGTIAANFLPFGTRVRIGNKIYTVTDRMNSRYNGKYVIDIWKPSKSQAIQHGARVLGMKIVSVPSPQNHSFQIIDSLKNYLSP